LRSTASFKSKLKSFLFHVAYTAAYDQVTVTRLTAATTVKECQRQASTRLAHKWSLQVERKTG